MAKNDSTQVDQISKHELELYAYNTYALYGQFKSIIANLQRKIAAGKYDARLPPRLWLYWVDEAAHLYCREFSTGRISDTFSKATREALAAEIAATEYGKIVAGEYEGGF